MPKIVKRSKEILNKKHLRLLCELIILNASTFILKKIIFVFYFKKEVLIFYFFFTTKFASSHKVKPSFSNSKYKIRELQGSQLVVGSNQGNVIDINIHTGYSCQNPNFSSAKKSIYILQVPQKCFFPDKSAIYTSLLLQLILQMSHHEGGVNFIFFRAFFQGPIP